MDYENIYDFIENYPYQVVGQFNGLDIRLYSCDMAEYVDLNLKDIEMVSVHNPDITEEELTYAKQSALAAYLSGFITYKMIWEEKGYAFYAIMASNADFIPEEDRKFYIGHEIGHIMCGHHETEQDPRPDMNVIHCLSEEFAADNYSVIELENEMPTWERTVEMAKKFVDSKYGKMYKELMPEDFEFNFSDKNADKARFDDPPTVIKCPQCGSRHISDDYCEEDDTYTRKCLNCNYEEQLN